MAKRRILKKDISRIAGDLFSEVLVCKLYIPGVDQEKADALLTRILDIEDDLICRAHRPDGKDNPQWVKAYYRKLLADLQKEADEISDGITALSK